MITFPTTNDYYFNTNFFSGNPGSFLITLGSETEFSANTIYKIQLNGLPVCCEFLGGTSLESLTTAVSPSYFSSLEAPIFSASELQFRSQSYQSCLSSVTPNTIGVIYRLENCCNPTDIRWAVGQLDIYENGTTLYYENNCFTYSISVVDITVSDPSIIISGITKNDVYDNCENCRTDNLLTACPTTTPTPTPTQTPSPQPEP